jgi:hypothetical protein
MEKCVIEKRLVRGVQAGAFLSMRVLRMIRSAGWQLALFSALCTQTGCGKAQQADGPAPARPDSTLRILAVGDIMMGSDYPSPDAMPPLDGTALFAPVSPLLRGGDLTFGNLEGPLLDGGKTTKCIDPKNCYAFRTPTRYGALLRDAGFRVLSIANNHALDFGEAGRRSTIRVLDSLGIGHSGPVGDVYRTVIRGKTVALIAFSYDDDSHNLLKTEEAVALVRRLSAEQDVVIVSFHGGAEGARHQHVPDNMEVIFGEDRGHLRLFTHAVVDAGADLVIGHGPHVVRGLEIYKQRLIAYSLGNFVTYAQFNLNGPNGLSCVLDVHLAPDGRFERGRIHPTLQDKPGGALMDDSGQIIPIVRQLSQEDFGTSAAVVTEDGFVRAR